MQKSLYNICPVWLQNAGVSLYGYYLKKKRYSGQYRALIQELRTFKTKSPDEVRDEQNKRFLKIVRSCFEEIPYYRKKFREQGLTLGEIKSLDDLVKLPILEKKEIQDNQSQLISTNRQHLPFWFNQTSGSSGTPLRVALNEYTYKLYTALLVDFEKDQGIDLGERRATFAGRMLQEISDNRPPFWRFNIAENQMLYSAYHLNERHISDYMLSLKKFDPVEIIGYPSAISTLADLARKRKLRADLNLKAIITNSESLLDWQRSSIEDYFQTKVCDTYGTSENVVFAAQCVQKRYHVNPLLGYVETESVSEGGIGALIVTTLCNETMPLLRYRIGDSASLYHQQCECGSHYQCIASIVGRNDDNIISKDGKVIGRLDHIFKGLSGIVECQIVQKKVDVFELNLVVDLDFDRVQLVLLKENLKARVGAEIAVSFNFLDAITRGKNGKFKGVVSFVGAAVHDK